MNPFARSRPRRRALVVATVVLSTMLTVAVASLGPIAAPADAQDDPGGAISVWRVVPEDRAVDVEIEYDRINDLEAAIGGVFETLPATAIDISATSGRGVSLEVASMGLRGEFVELFVSFGELVEPGDHFDWVLRYRVPSDPPDAVVHAFVDDAVVWLSSFAVDQRVAGGPVRHVVELPGRFQLPATASIEVAARSGDRWLIEATTLDAYTPFVVAAEDPAARPEGVPVDTVGIEGLRLVPLPSDGGWVTRHAGEVVDLLEALGTAFGRPLPVSGLDVVEMPVPLVRHPVVTVAEGVPEAVVVLSSSAPADEIAHQLAHLWLHDLVGHEPWFVEGLASAMGAEAGRTLGLGFVADLPVEADLESGSTPLEDWMPDDGRSPGSDPGAAEFGYDASFVVIDSVVTEIGPGAMQDVLDVLRDATITYVGRPEPEPQPRPPDWRTTLDALVEVGGSDVAAGLYARVVFAETSRREFDGWRDARATWISLVDEAGEWKLPLVLRRPMAAWDFDEAMAAAAEMAVVLDHRESIAETFEDELGVPIPLRAGFERTEAGELEELVDSFAERVEHAERVAEAVQVGEASHGLIADVGLLGEDPDADLDRLVALWGSGSTAEAADSADELVELVEGATGRGMVRILVPILAVGVLLASAVSLRRRHRGDGGTDELEPDTIALEEEKGRRTRPADEASRVE